MDYIAPPSWEANDNRYPLSMGYFEEVFSSKFVTVPILKDPRLANELKAFIVSMKFQFPNHAELAKWLEYIFDQLTNGNFVTSSKVVNRPEEFFKWPDGVMRAYNMLVWLKDSILSLPNPVIDAYPALKNTWSYEETKLLIFTVLWSFLQVTLSYFNKMGIANKSILEAIEKAWGDVSNLVEFKKEK